MDSVDIRQLKKGQLIEVTTEGSAYLMEVEKDMHRGMVRVQGGSKSLPEQRVRVTGDNDEPIITVGVGMHLGRPKVLGGIRTSPVKAIELST